MTTAFNHVSGFRKMRLCFRLSTPLVLLALAGCTLGPDVQAPATALPAKFSGGKATSNGDVALAEWWKAFSDQLLTRYIDQGLNENLDILQAMERIEQARANVDSAAAGSLPSLVGTGSSTVSKTVGSYSSSETSTKSGGGLSVSWLLDLFGQYRRAKESALASLGASYASVDVARLSLISNVSTYYISARYYQERLLIARQNLKSRRETLDLTKKQREAGTASQLEVVQAEGLVNATLADIPGLETSFRQSVHRISTLLGLPAATLVADMAKGGRQPVARDRIKAGIPADLIRNRPDIRKAELELAAATANIGEAEAKLYPSLTLSGSISPSYVSTASAKGSMTTWSFGPSLNLPIFDGGALRAGVKSAKSSANEAYLAWKQTVLNGVEEVENALVALSKDRMTEQALRAEVISYQTALRLSMASYRDGASTLLDVLDAQRSVSTAQASLADAIRQTATDYVTLNVAIGGGYAAQKP